jgi:hypothetical protein
MISFACNDMYYISDREARQIQTREEEATNQTLKCRLQMERRNMIAGKGEGEGEASSMKGK